MADNNFKVEVYDAVKKIMAGVKKRCEDPHYYVRDLYAIEMYINQLFGQEMEWHLEEMRRSTKEVKMAWNKDEGTVRAMQK